MTRKTKGSYIAVVETLKKLFPRKKFTSLSTDYEKNIGDAAQHVFKGIKLKKFYFHFTQVNNFIYTFV